MRHSIVSDPGCIILQNQRKWVVDDAGLILTGVKPLIQRRRVRSESGLVTGCWRRMTVEVLIKISAH